MDKAPVCRCEEVTRREIQDAIAAGAESVSWVKRMTRAGMGACQGRTCGPLVARILQEELGWAPHQVPPDTARPPRRPVSLGLLAETCGLDSGGGGADASGARAADLRSAGGIGSPPGAGPVLTGSTTDVIIIGGGSTGAATAYYLARAGVKAVLVEKNQVAAEGGGRNVGGVRQLGRHPAEMAMALQSLREFETLGQELEAETEFRRMGYLWVAMDQEEWELQVRLLDVQRQLGASLELLDRTAIHQQFPVLSEAVVGGTWSPQDGQANPMKVTRGYARAAARLGARILAGTTVTGIQVSGGKVAGVATDRGEIRAPAVLIAAGAWSVELGALVGLKIPIRPGPNQIMVTEPIPPVLDPLVLSHGAICLQGITGNMYVGNTSPAPEMHGMDKQTSFAEMGKTARNILEVIPALRPARVIRSWAGILDYTPDDIPIIGPAPEVDGLYLACGFSGHGFALTPVIGRVLAEMMTTGRPSFPLHEFGLERFELPETMAKVEHFAHQRM